MVLCSSQVVPKCCPCCCQVVSIGLHLNHNAATRCVEWVPTYILLLLRTGLIWKAGVLVGTLCRYAVRCGSKNSICLHKKCNQGLRSALDTCADINKMSTVFFVTFSLTRNCQVFVTFKLTLLWCFQKSSLISSITNWYWVSKSKSKRPSNLIPAWGSPTMKSFENCPVCIAGALFTRAVQASRKNVSKVHSCWIPTINQYKKYQFGTVSASSLCCLFMWSTRRLFSASL